MSGGNGGPVVTRRGALRRSVSPLALASVGLGLAGVAGLWLLFGGTRPAADYDAVDTAQPVAVRRITPRPPEPAPQPVSLSVPAPPEHHFVMPPPQPEPAAVTAAPSTNNGPLVTRYTGENRASAQPAALPGSGAAASARGGVAFKQPQVEGGEALVVTDLGRTIKPTTRIGCTLGQAIDGTHAGPLVCSITRPVRSWDLSTVLLPAGTPVIGTYQPLSIGQGRMMAMAAQAITSDGMIVPLGGSAGSPMTDDLGRLGMDGHVDARFWERIGNALITDAALSAFALPEAALRSQSRGIQFNTNDTQLVVSQVLQSTVNLPPIFRKNQGEEIQILVTAPVHFGAVHYEVVR